MKSRACIRSVLSDCSFNSQFSSSPGQPCATTNLSEIGGEKKMGKKNKHRILLFLQRCSIRGVRWCALRLLFLSGVTLNDIPPCLF